MVSKIYVGNLNFRTTEDSLKTVFSAFGQINDLKMVHDRDTGNFKGFAFITFASPESAKQAITEMNGKDLEGRALRVNLAEEKPKNFQPRY
ncbi:RNA recognition motif domain-containing protein [Leptospira sp. GIMC2001]|uniref:RNA recognition motif domain-containing protein n=1 Tax=Leptospira sp. GIMC2001 TaxID=1513297 RepID=UPI00234B2921|nr:RNA-binding protein [Leptospira sp. GIMC2001]WCL48074.1 RNA-binding protein [Leptospira sp. GIMC2001]